MKNLISNIYSPRHQFLARQPVFRPERPEFDVSVRLYRSFSDHRLAALIRIFFGDCASPFTTAYFSSLSYGSRPVEFSPLSSLPPCFLRSFLPPSTLLFSFFILEYLLSSFSFFLPLLDSRSTFLSSKLILGSIGLSSSLFLLLSQVFSRARERAFWKGLKGNAIKILDNLWLYKVFLCHHGA